MARKYKFHRYYGVIWYTEPYQKTYVADNLTLREAREYLSIVIKKHVCVCATIIKMIKTVNERGEDIPIEEI